MKSVLQLLNQAYTKIQVKSKYTDLDDDQKQEGIDELNQMMWEHDASGLPVNWSDVSEVTETVPEPDWMFSMMANGLAIRLAPNYGVQIDPRIIGMYKAGLDAAMKRLVPIPKLLYPNILPTGRSRHRYHNHIYFQNPNENALVGQGGYLRDESGKILNSENKGLDADSNQ